MKHELIKNVAYKIAMHWSWKDPGIFCTELWQAAFQATAIVPQQPNSFYPFSNSPSEMVEWWTTKSHFPSSCADKRRDLT